MPDWPREASSHPEAVVGPAENGGIEHRGLTSGHEFGCIAVLPYNLIGGVTRVSLRRIGEAAWWTRQHHDGAGTRRLARERRESGRRRRVVRARPRRLFG